MDSGNFDKNNRYGLFVSSNADGKTPVSLWADPITHALVVSGASGSGGLTDTQIRATPLPVSGTVTISNPTTSPETGLAKDSSLTTIDTDIKSNITLHAGTNLIGKAGIDQTTDGTTNKVFIGNIPHVIVDSAPTTAVTGTFFQATQPVSLATNTPDVTDRAARLLGHVTVDNASIAVTGTFFQVTQPVSLATNTPTLQSGSTTTVTQATGTNLHVVVDSAPSTAVTNAGTFAVQATLSAETTKVIGTVNQGTSPWVTNDPGIPDTLGQKARASAAGVTLSSEDITALTPPAPITGYSTSAAQTDKSQFTKMTDGTDTALITAAGEQNVLDTNSAAIKADLDEIALDTDNLIPPTTILNGKTSVATSGSRVVLAASTACKSVTVKALAANTGIIYVGSSTVSAANGFALAAGDSVSFDIANLNTVNLDCSVSGESVTYLGIN